MIYSNSRYNRYRFLCCLLLPLTIGCSHLHEWKSSGKVGPDYQTPAAHVAPSWNQYNSPSVIASKNAVDDCQWWKVFGDPEINHLVHHANTNYLPLRAAILRVNEQFYRRRIAVGNLAPQQQEAFAEYQRLQFSENGNQIGIAGIGNSFSLYDIGFNVNWELDVWGRLRRLVESSDAQLHVSIEDEHDIRLSLTSDVVASYIEIRVLQQRIQIARDQISAQNETVRIASSRFENGTTSKLDVTQARSNAETTAATIPSLQSQLRQANNRLCLLLGIPPTVLFDEHNTGQIPFTPDNVVVGMPVDLIRRRPDIRRAEREVASQSALVGVAAAELFPTFSLRGTVNWQAFDFKDLFQSQSNGGAIVPGVRWDILNYGRLRNNVEVQNSKLAQAISNYRHTILSANSEVEDALTDFSKKKEQLVSLQRAVDALHESLDLAVAQYKAGDVDLDRVNNLRKELIAQLDIRTSVEGQAAIALIRVYKTMGGGWALPNSGHKGICQNASSAKVPPMASESIGNAHVFHARQRLSQTQQSNQHNNQPNNAPRFGYQRYPLESSALKASPMKERSHREWSVSLFQIDSHQHQTGDEPAFAYHANGIAKPVSKPASKFAPIVNTAMRTNRIASQASVFTPLPVFEDANYR